MINLIITKLGELWQFTCCVSSVLFSYDLLYYIGKHIKAKWYYCEYADFSCRTQPFLSARFLIALAIGAVANEERMQTMIIIKYDIVEWVLWLVCVNLAIFNNMSKQNRSHWLYTRKNFYICISNGYRNRFNRSSRRASLFSIDWGSITPWFR